MDDNEFETDEQFRLVLGNARTDSGLLAMIGELNETTITVHDVGDSKSTSSQHHALETL